MSGWVDAQIHLHMLSPSCEVGGDSSWRRQRAHNSLPLFLPSLERAPTNSLLPNQQRWYVKMEAQLEYMVYIAYTFLHFWRRFVRSVIAYYKKNSATKLSRKFIKSALLVGYVVPVLVVVRQLLGGGTMHFIARGNGGGGESA